MYKYTKLLLPPFFNNLFTENRMIHNYPTRHSHLLRIPLVKTKLAENFITKTGVHIWNRITTTMDTNVKLGTFKKTYKTLLINNYSIFYFLFFVLANSLSSTAINTRLCEPKSLLTTHQRTGRRLGQSGSSGIYSKSNPKWYQPGTPPSSPPSTNPLSLLALCHQITKS